MSCFEVGPIRPPSEAESILIRVTRNCHWNKCAFCPVYKGARFSMRKADEVKRDIDIIASIAERILTELDRLQPVRSDNQGVIRVMRDIDFGDDIDYGCARQVAFWVYHGMKSIFLQDADALVLKPHDLADILRYARERFPSVERITAYSRAQTVARRTPDELAMLRDAGINRIHIGMESGSDEVLSLANKGTTKAQQIEAGRKAIEAGFELSEYYMPGLGGLERWEENARESADVLNRINPTFIRIRSTIPVPGTPLHDMMREGRWIPLTDEGIVREIRLFLCSLEGITSMVQNDHIMNLLEEVEGRLPEDRETMCNVIDRFFEMNEADRESFIVGRRIGRYRFLSDYAALPEVESIKRELKLRYGSLDSGIRDILTNYI